MTLAAAFFTHVYACAGSGVTWDDFLTSFLDAKPAGLAGSYVATAYGTSAMFVNPAGLSSLRSAELAASHTADIYDRSIEHICLGLPLAGFVFGFSATYNYTSNFIEIDEFGDAKGSVVNYDTMACASVSKILFPSFSAGINLKYFNSFLYNRSRNGIALDMGAIGSYNIYKLGISVQNLGVQSAYISVADPLPLLARFGLGLSMPVLNSDKFSAEAGACLPFDQTEEKSFNFGAEYESNRVLSIRAGIKIYQESGANLYIGAGARLDKFLFDYSLGTIPGQGKSNRITITCEL